MWITTQLQLIVKALSTLCIIILLYIISASTCHDRRTPFSNKQHIVRLKLQKVSSVIMNKGIPIVPYIKENRTGLSKITFKELPALESSHVTPAIHYRNILWNSLYFVIKNTCCNWSEFMSEKGFLVSIQEKRRSHFSLF